MSAPAGTISCIVGTRAQLIKMAPVLLELERRRVAYRFVLTGQHEETIADLLAEFGIATRPERLFERGEVTRAWQAPWWFLGGLGRLWRRRRELLGAGGGRRGVAVVHGDTFSTLLGALAGRLAGAWVVHVESGLRSFRLLHPFPEELTRRLVFRLTDVACCPGRWACENLAGYRLERLDTGGNTLVDAVALARRAAPGPAREDAYAVCSLHRFENIFRRRRFDALLGLVERAAARCPVVFVLHPATRARLLRYGWLGRLEANPRIELRARMGYLDFMRLLAAARFVITDGGSNQEELSYLGIPTLLMREATERTEGLGETATLGGSDPAVLERFLDGLRDAPRPAFSPPLLSPSALIAERLESLAGGRPSEPG